MTKGNPPVAKDPKNDPEAAEQSAQRKREGWSFRFEMLVAVSTVVTAIVSGYQGCLTRESLDLTRDSNQLTRDALNDARTNRTTDLATAKKIRDDDGTESKRVADATLGKMQESNDLTRRNLAESDRRFRQSERPWVGVANITMGELAVGKTITARAVVVNTGKSPAVRGRMCGQLSPQYIPVLPPNCPGMEHPGHHSSFIVVPGVINFGLPFENRNEMTAEGIKFIQNGDIPIYAYGWIEYFDPLPQGRCRLLTFCFEWSTKLAGFIGCEGTEQNETRDCTTQEASMAFPVGVK